MKRLQSEYNIMSDTSQFTGPSDTIIRGFIKSGFSVSRKASERIDVVKMKLYNAFNTAELPGSLVLWKQSNLSKQSDPAVLEVWNHTEKYCTFLRETLEMYSIDHRGKCVISSVHVGKRLCNAFWNGYFMVYGDGDLSKYLQPFCRDPMIIYHELTHGVIQYNFPLDYSGQSGAINEHVADVFSVIAHHYLNESTPKCGRWDPGSMIVTKRGMSLRTFDDNKAYDYEELGTDEQVKHASNFYEGPEDEGGVHINSGILNHMFYIFCTLLDEVIWEKPLKIWYGALVGIRHDCEFEEFAGRLATSCDNLYSNRELEFLIGALQGVGIA